MDTNGSHWFWLNDDDVYSYSINHNYYRNLIDNYCLIKNQYGDIPGKTCWNDKKWIYKEDNMEQTDKFTAEEKIILKNIDSKYHWITRDSNDEKGNLWLFRDKPHKYNGYWDNYTDGGTLFLPFKNIFKNIKWEDDEPTYIKYNNILDDEEKRFIKKYIIENPAYRNKSELYLVKEGGFTAEDGIIYATLFIEDKSGEVLGCFPRFDVNKMYVGMERDKKYKIDEIIK